MVKRDRIESGGFVNGVNGGSKIRAVNCGYCSATVAFSLADVEEHLKVGTFTAYIATFRLYPQSSLYKEESLWII